VIRRRPDRVAAAFLLVALVAALSLLARPAGPASAVSAPSLDVSATVRHGCAVGADPEFVEVTLSRRTKQPADQLVVQVGLVGPGHANSQGDTDNVVTDNPPSQVTLSSDKVTVRLAGVPRTGDHVLLNRMDHPASYASVAVPTSCRRVNKTNFGLTEPDVVVSPSACHGSRASLTVSITNPNPVGTRLHDLGIDQLDYTVLLVRGSNKQLAGEPLSGRLLSFTADGEQTQLAKIVQTASTPDSYEIQVVGPDGAVEVPGDRRLSCDAVDPHPSPSLTLTPVPPSSIGTSHGSPTPTPTRTHSTSRPASSAPASSTASHPAPSSSSAPVVVSVPPVSSQPATTSHSTPAKRSSPAPQPTSTPSSPSTPTPTASKTVAEAPPLKGLVGSGIQRSALLIVAAFAVAMAGLVGATVRNARRR
jgi:hypothetical protein